MIPIRLKMHNFMPYRGEVPELSFANIHTACISGENGSGKSAIIDAITWALWGKTRAKSDDDLVHQGENHTEVEFEFALGNELYRVIRKHSHPKTSRTSGKGSLDFFIHSGTSFIPISADTKSQTEQKITQLLHMDYETFINSAFLRQGHAGEFSRQTPARRKEVLTSILGLSQYDEYEAMAKDKARIAQEEQTRLEASIGEAAAEMEKRPSVVTEITKAETDLHTIDQDLGTSRTQLDALRTRHHELATMDAQRQKLDESMTCHEADLAMWNATRAESQSKITSYQNLVAEQKNIEDGYTRLKNARKQDDELSGQARQLYQLKERQGKLEREFLQAQAEQNTRYKVTEERVAKLEERASRGAELRREMADTQPRYKELRDSQFFIDNYRVISKEKTELMARCTADINGLTREIEQIQEKTRLIVAPSDDTCCPLCESELGADRITLVKKKLEQDERDKNALILKLEQSRQVLTASTDKLNKDIDRVESDYKVKNNSLVSDVARLTEAIREASIAEEQLTNQRAELACIAESLAKRDYATSTLGQLAEVEAAIVGTNYDEARHQAVKNDLKELGDFENLGRDLKEALSLMPAEQAKVEKTEEMLKDIAGRKARDQAIREELLVQLAGMPRIKQELEQAEAEERNLSTRHREAQQQFGSLKERLDQLDALSAKLKERQNLLAQAKHRRGIFDELALIFGKKGIQAMLIETILPEIEDEANRLLSRMTSGRMNVTFETQRDTKKGDVAETLDIKIADELGTRNYEMFSGGEAFRIDFAIRIALSRLLARRAGASLPTIIIDEGFGTQDTDGIDKLKEAISSIQTEFQKIIVITHIEELKDAFPVRINVIKTAEGSKIEISES